MVSVQIQAYKSRRERGKIIKDFEAEGFRVTSASNGFVVGVRYTRRDDCMGAVLKR